MTTLNQLIDEHAQLYRTLLASSGQDDVDPEWLQGRQDRYDALDAVIHQALARTYPKLTYPEVTRMMLGLQVSHD